LERHRVVLPHAENPEAAPAGEEEGEKEEQEAKGANRELD
jgi:hypothetical protein